jgi:hypothetical protein
MGAAEGVGLSASATDGGEPSTGVADVQALPARIRARTTAARFITISRPDFRAEGSSPRGTMVDLRR